METALRYFALPSGRRSGKVLAGASMPFRASIRYLVVALPLAGVLFASTCVARAQQWPGSDGSTHGLPPQGSPQDPRNLPAPITPGLDPDPLAPMESNSAMTPLMPIDNSRLINTESCQTWTEASVNSPTVSVSRLDVPTNASHEFQKGCGDFKGKRFSSAEGHARRAVKIYPNYAAAWVLLGQILLAEDRAQGAIDACRNGENADPKYAPPYICLAEFAARANDWDEAYALSNRALSLDPATDPYAYLSAATADYHLKRMEEAEHYALSAEKLDKWHHIPEVHLLLASVYEAGGDPQKESRELRLFVKESPHNTDWEAARSKLAALEDHATK